MTEASGEPFGAAPDARGPSVDAAEVAKFAALASDWWDPKGPLKPLHALNPIRLGHIRERVVEAFGRDPDARRPFEGLKMLDVGCGGGLLTEPLARLGGDVTGIDASEANVAAARAHAAQSGLEIDYRAQTAEALLDDLQRGTGGGPFDVVLAMEIVEHVADPDAFLRTCAKLVAPGGLAVFATLNRTPKAYALAIVAAERMLGWLEPGTHDWNKFLTPDELTAPLAAEGLAPEPPMGVTLEPLAGRWRLSGDVGVNYMLAARRPR